MQWLTPEVIVGVLTLLTAIVGFLGAYLKLEQLHQTTNSKMDELLVQKGLASEAIGNVKGRAEARRIDAKAKKPLGSRT